VITQLGQDKSLYVVTAEHDQKYLFCIPRVARRLNLIKADFFLGKDCQ